MASASTDALPPGPVHAVVLSPVTSWSGQSSDLDVNLSIHQHLFAPPSFGDKTRPPLPPRHRLSPKRGVRGGRGHGKYFHLLFIPPPSSSSSINKRCGWQRADEKTETETYQTQAVAPLNRPPPPLHPSTPLPSPSHHAHHFLVHSIFFCCYIALFIIISLGLQSHQNSSCRKFLDSVSPSLSSFSRRCAQLPVSWSRHDNATHHFKLEATLMVIF